MLYPWTDPETRAEALAQHAAALAIARDPKTAQPEIYFGLAEDFLEIANAFPQAGPAVNDVP